MRVSGGKCRDVGGAEQEFLGVDSTRGRAPSAYRADSRLVEYLFKLGQRSREIVDSMCCHPAPERVGEWGGELGADFNGESIDCAELPPELVGISAWRRYEHQAGFGVGEIVNT